MTVIAAALSGSSVRRCTARIGFYLLHMREALACSPAAMIAVVKKGETATCLETFDIDGGSRGAERSAAKIQWNSEFNAKTLGLSATVISDL